MLVAHRTGCGYPHYEVSMLVAHTGLGVAALVRRLYVSSTQNWLWLPSLGGWHVSSTQNWVWLPSLGGWYVSSTQNWVWLPSLGGWYVSGTQNWVWLPSL